MTDLFASKAFNIAVAPSSSKSLYSKSMYSIPLLFSIASAMAIMPLFDMEFLFKFKDLRASFVFNDLAIAIAPTSPILLKFKSRCSRFSFVASASAMVIAAFLSALSDFNSKNLND